MVSEAEPMRLLNFRTHAEAEKEAKAWRKDGRKAHVEMDMKASRWMVIVAPERKPTDG